MILKKFNSVNINKSLMHTKSKYTSLVFVLIFFFWYIVSVFCFLKAVTVHVSWTSNIHKKPVNKIVTQYTEVSC